MAQTNIYPENPTVQGALSRAVLAARAHEEWAHLRELRYYTPRDWGDDYDILAGAILLNSMESIGLCLDLGISPFHKDDFNIFDLILRKRYENPSEQGSKELMAVVVGHASFDAEKFQQRSWEVMRDAILNNDLASFDFLLQSGADPYKISDMGYNIIHVAYGKSVDMDTVEVLLGRYPELLNATTNAGGTALTMAAENQDNPRAVYRLLDAGADPLAEGEGAGGLLHAMKWYKYQSNGHDPNQIIENLRSRISRENWEVLIRRDNKNLGLPILTMIRANLCIDFTTVAPGGDVDVFGPGAENGKGGLSAIGTACLLNSRKSMRRLIEGGADFGNITAKGHTCWHLWAIMADDLEKLRGGSDYYNLLVKENNHKFLRRLFLKTGMSPETLSDAGEHPLVYTNSEQAKMFFAQQRRRSLETTPGQNIERKRPVM